MAPHVFLKMDIHFEYIHTYIHTYIYIYIVGIYTNFVYSLTVFEGFWDSISIFYDLMKNSMTKKGDVSTNHSACQIYLWYDHNYEN